ncbi:MAG: tRNA (adenosine(37)-N6)-dimethylallyltransferase MiaA [Bacilli bacterium]|jgi:tRNA dimethylallyltransferase|nr:tRNA (adenosine(37)-N6)-dimethylallyltransferase MiaA [Bacilli bacterium]NLN80402.1 tRNA (adenosine(37)-N6)-dimethylallyltransferase MiaA [Erysipelotrichia bacterium]
MIIVITGPTHTGKDQLAVALAKKIKGEIINADAFHIYKQLEIGTNKPQNEQFQNIKHHLFSYVNVDEPYSIATYQKDARLIIDDLIKKNIPIILLGGSGLYIKAALFNYHFLEQKKVDMSLYQKMNNEELFKTLVKIDPLASEKIHPHNRRRVLRAIEIYLAQGIKKSDNLLTRKDELLYEAKFFGLKHNRQTIYDGIDKRVDLMIEKGLLKEVKYLYEKYGDNIQALEAIGYKELITSLKGEISVEEAIKEIKKNTRRYVKRQMTFCNNQLPMHWVSNVKEILEITYGK